MDQTAGNNVLSDKGHLHATSFRPSLSFLSIISRLSPFSLSVLHYFEMGDKVSCCHHFHLMSAQSLSTVPGMSAGFTLCLQMIQKGDPHCVSTAGRGWPWEKSTLYGWQGGHQGLIVLPSETWINPVADLECYRKTHQISGGQRCVNLTGLGQKH